MAGDYRFELATFTPGEIAATSALLCLVFPKAKHLTPAYLKWIYADNPDGRAIACNAWYGDTLVGHMASTPHHANVDGAQARGIYLLNGAVHPEHRGKRLQSDISAGMFEEAVRQRYDYGLGTGNKYSTGPLLTRFKMIRPLDARLGIGKPKRRLTALQSSIERVWSAEALRWRMSNPTRKYAVKNGQILAPTGTPGISAILHDHVDMPDTAGRSGAKPLRLFLGLDPVIDWQRSSFVSIPPRLRPSPLNLVWRDLQGGLPVPDPDRFVFRAIDFDPY